MFSRKVPWHITAGMGGWSPIRYVAALLLIPALLSGCGSMSTSKHAAPTATATAALLPAASLVWQPVAGAVPLPFALAPSDGNTAYTCQVRRQSPRSSMAVASAEVTHDRGAHWGLASDIASGQMTAAQPQENGYCEMVVDQQQANIAVMVAQSRAASENLAATTTVVTFDGGMPWQPLASSQPATIRALGTMGNTTYAIREVGVGRGTVCAGGGQTDFMVSTDHMRTWSVVGGFGTSGQVAGFWLNPTQDEMLVEVSDGSSVQLWNGLRDQNGQRMWLGYPSAPKLDAVVVQRPPNVPQPWHICGAVVEALADWLTCSDNGGITWTSRASLTLTIPPPPGTVPPGSPPKKGGSLPGTLVALADDASVLATLNADPKTGQYSQQVWLYRLARGASAWQPVGDAPLDAVWYAPEPADGLLWSQQAVGTPGASGAGNDVFTAVYP